MGVNACEFGADRDDQIVRLIGQLRYLTAQQVARVLFGGRRRVAARRLLRLTQQGRLRSARLRGTHGPMVYWVPPRHLTRAVYEALDLSELYCRLRERRPPNGVLDRFDVELRLKSIRSDAVILLRSAVKEQAILLEWDRGTCSLEQVAAKIPAYEKYAQSGDYRRSAWWRSGLAVQVVFAVPAERVPMLTRAAADMRGKLKPLIVSHSSLLLDPWQVLMQWDRSAKEDGISPGCN